MQPASFKPPVSERAISEPPGPEEASALRRVFAFLVGLCWAGAGQVVLGRYVRAAGWAVAQILCMALTSWFWPMAFVAIVLHVVAAFEVFSLRPGHLPDTALAFGGVVIALLVQMGGALAVRIFAVEAYVVSSAGMAPTLLPGDHVFASKLGFRPSVGKVVVYERSGVEFIHRVVAGPGDTVRYEAGRLHVNGAPVPVRPADQPCPEAAHEPGGAFEGCQTFSESLGGSEHSLMKGRDEHDGTLDECPPNTQAAPQGCRIPEAHWFLLGDYRTNSADSRGDGAVASDAIEGGVTSIWMSLGRDGKIEWKRVGRRVK